MGTNSKCDRAGCENIMCNTLVEGKYYICHDCKFEFEHYIDKERKVTLGRLMLLFVQFIATEKLVANPTDQIYIDDFWKEHSVESEG